MTQITYNLPAVWAPYLVNGDRDALVFEAGHTQEIDSIDEWLRREELGSCLSCSQTPCFTWKPDGPVGLGAECLVFTFALHTGHHHDSQIEDNTSRPLGRTEFGR